MAHLVESMMYVRETPWHGLGTRVETAPTSAEALRLAGLDWEVTSESIYTEAGIEIPGWKANTRSKDNTVLGVVTDRYRICQNTEAFSFTDNLIGGEVHYETAGSLRNGKTVWLLAKLPQTKVAGDEVDPYLCFTNTHDGSGAIRACVTPIRVVCNNTLTIAFNGAKRHWATKHVGDLNEKMQEAREVLAFSEEYMYNLDKKADDLANAMITRQTLDEILNEMWPVQEDDSDRRKETVKKTKDEYMVCYFAPDIQKFMGTAWGAINAMSDMVTHNAPKRQTANYRENNWGKLMDGHPVLDTFTQKVMERVGL